MSSKHFNNELGNEIAINVEEMKISNIPGVLLTISGPESLTQVHITRQEAEVLSEELQNLLSSKK